MVHFKGPLASDTNKRSSRQDHLTLNSTKESPAKRFLQHIWLLQGSFHFPAEKPPQETLQHPPPQCNFYQVSKRWELVEFFPLFTDDHSPLFSPFSSRHM